MAFGLPLPHTLPFASLLTHRLGAAAVLKACCVVVSPAGPAARRAAGGATYPFELAAAGVLAVGVFLALRRRRREQLRRRDPGRRVNGPRPDAALAQTALREGASDPAVRLLDDGLRQLGQELAAGGRDLPTVHAAHLGEDTADLWISPPDRDAPAPWTAVDDGQVWRLPLDAAPPPDLGQLAPAPYPVLVSIGADDAGQVLVDLAGPPGLIGVSGPDRLARAALVAIAAELATSVLADQIRVTLVGFGADLVGLAPDRVRAARTIAEVLAWLQAETGASGVRQHTPHVIVAAVPPSAEEADWMADLAESGSPVTFLVAGEAPEGASVWELTGEGRIRIGALGLEVRANLLLPEQRAAVVDLFLAAGRSEGVEFRPPAAGDGWEEEPGLETGPGRAARSGLADWHARPEARGPGLAEAAGGEHRLAGVAGAAVAGAASGEHGPAPRPRLAEAAGGEHRLAGEAGAAVAGAASRAGGLGLAGERAPGLPLAASGPVEIRLLGPVSVRAPGQIEPDRMAIAAEIVVYLATHPGGVHPNVLSGAVWPRGVTAEVRDAVIGRVRDWLGADGIGRPHLATDAGGRLRLGSQARVDWQVFQSLLPRVGGEDERDRLAEALALVDGPFLAGRPRGRYAWLVADGLESEAEASVADAAHRLAELRLAGADPHGSMAAARAGLRLARDDELLWRDLLTAAHATGDERLLGEVAGQARAKAEQDEVLPRLAPQTEALLDELLPSWRTIPG